MTRPVSRGLRKAPRAIARAPHTPGKMNGLENAYAVHLKLRELAGEVSAWQFEAVKFRLAERTFFTPDFFVVMADRSIEIHEVKGHWEDDARVKMKVAARLWPYFTWKAYRRPKVRGLWIEEVF